MKNPQLHQYVQSVGMIFAAKPIELLVLPYVIGLSRFYQ